VAGLALYLHIPFCVRKCRYCAFVSRPPGDGSTGNTPVQDYLRALRREIGTAASLAGRQTLGSIYFGGGTPTLLDPSDLVSLLEETRDHFDWGEDMEITVEANPGTVSLVGLRLLRDAGVNRISIGAQSFNPEELGLLGRIHGVTEIYSAYYAAREAGFDNVNLDLIYGIPGQTLSGWRASLEKALDLYPEHLSVYGLSLEEGTPLAEEIAKGWLQACPEETQVAMWEITGRLLKAAGYERYEIANFASPGRQCRHNLTYWLNLPYLGLGAAAHGYFNGIRYANHSDLETYIESSLQGKLPRAWEEHQTPEQERNDTIIMGLRLTRGLSRSAFRDRFGYSFEDLFGDQLNALEQEGLMGKNKGFIYLTERGRLLANYVLAHFV